MYFGIGKFSDMHIVPVIKNLIYDYTYFCNNNQGGNVFFFKKRNSVKPTGNL
jgi:hypothetical protein